MTSTALVGPLSTIRFQDGTKVAYEPPRNTCDKRYSACRDHRPACDCREAHHAEDLGEYRAALREIEDAFREVLRDHATWAFIEGTGGWNFERRCQCTGCQIARITHVRPMYEQTRDGVPVHRPADWKAPR